MNSKKFIAELEIDTDESVGAELPNLNN